MQLYYFNVFLLPVRSQEIKRVNCFTTTLQQAMFLTQSGYFSIKLFFAYYLTSDHKLKKTTTFVIFQDVSAFFFLIVSLFSRIFFSVSLILEFLMHPRLETLYDHCFVYLFHFQFCYRLSLVWFEMQLLEAVFDLDQNANGYFIYQYVIANTDIKSLIKTI